MYFNLYSSLKLLKSINFVNVRNVFCCTFFAFLIVTSLNFYPSITYAIENNNFVKPEKFKLNPTTVTVEPEIIEISSVKETTVVPQVKTIQDGQLLDLPIFIQEALAIGPEATSIDVTEWDLPPGSSPRFTAANPSGNEVYFTEYGTNKIAKLDLITNNITEWNISSDSEEPYGISYHDDSGKIVFTIAGGEGIHRIGVLDPNTDIVVEYIISQNSVSTIGTVIDSDNDIWFTGGSGSESLQDIYKLDIGQNLNNTDGVITKYNINDTPSGNIFIQIHGIDVTTIFIPEDELELDLVFVGSGLEQSDTSTGNVTHDVSQFERVGMLIPDFNEFIYYDLPEAGATPAIVSADSSGNVWFGESNANKIGVIEPSTDLLTQWAIPTENSDPFHIAVRSLTDVIFFTEYQTGKIGRLNPNTNIITEWTLPQGVVRPAGISFDNSNSMYIVAEGSEQILKIQRTPNLNIDLVTANSGDDNISLLLGNGNGNFGATTNFPIIGGLQPLSIATGDFNADTNLDVVTANQDSDNVSILLGNGNGNFGAATNFNTGSGPQHVVVEDFDNDFILDLAVVNINSDDLSILLGNGDGTFGASTNFTINGGNAPVYVETGDFNGDPNPDLAIAQSIGNSVAIFLGQGDGTFVQASPGTVSVGNNPKGIAIADFDKDTNFDLAVVSTSSDEVSIALGNGDDTFGSKTGFGVGVQPFGVATGDFDKDTNLDLAVTNSADDTVSILLGTGTGSFGTANDFNAGSVPSGIITEDFNDDTNLDLAIANNNQTGTISVLFGDGNGNFSIPSSFAVGDSPIIVATGNFDP